MTVYLVIYHHETGSWGDSPYTCNEKLFTTENKAKDYIEEQLKEKEFEEIECLSYKNCEQRLMDECNECCPKIKAFNVSYRDDNGKPEDFDWYDIESLELN